MTFKTLKEKFIISHMYIYLHINVLFLSECVALQDPYCAWDKQAGRCRSYSHGVSRWLDENSFYQSVSTGSHAACPHSQFITALYTFNIFF